MRRKVNVKVKSIGALGAWRIVVYTCRVHRAEFPDAEILGTFGGHRWIKCKLQFVIIYKPHIQDYKAQAIRIHKP